MQIAAVDLVVATSAICVEASRVFRHVDARPAVPLSVTTMAPQAEERGRLPEQIIRDGSVRFMTDGTILSHWRMLVDERALLFCMALPAHQVQRFGYEVALHLTVCIVAVGAGHLALPNRVVGWKPRLAEDLGMAFETCIRLID